MAPHRLALLLALWAVAGGAAVPLPDVCDLEVNKIKDLLQVSCVGKGLTELPVGLPHGTGILLLASNRLAQVSLGSFQDLHNLTDLDLANNSLGALKPGGAPLPTLQQLILSHNALRTLPTLQGLPQLRRLALGHNALSQLPEGGFQALRHLQDLELQWNLLRRLRPGAFAGLDQLKDLDLSDNLLEALPPELLVGLETLQILRLERNHLQAVPDNFFQGNLFAYIYLSGNPWRCDCQLLYLREWITENDVSVYTRVQGPGKETTEHDPESVTCQAPPKQKGRPVMYFQAACRHLGDSDGVAGGEGNSEPQPGSPTPPLTSTAGPTTGTLPPPSSTGPGASSTPMLTKSLVLTPTTIGTSPAILSTHTPATATGPSTTSLPGTRTPSALPPSTGVARLLPHSTATGPSTTSLPGTRMPSALPPSTGVARLLPHSTPLIPATTPATAFPGPAMPTSTCAPFPTPPFQCLCPVLPVRALKAAPQQRTAVPWAGGPAARCCPLRLALYVACLALVGLPVLVVLCCLKWVSRGWDLPALQAASLAGCPQLQQGQAEETRPPAGPQIYYVCKEFRVAPPLCHVTWLLVSLPGPAGQWPWDRGTGTPSSSSLGCGGDPLGAVQAK